MNKCLSCEFNIDTGNVECRFTDGTLLSIDCDAVENAIEIAAFPRRKPNWIGSCTTRQGTMYGFFSMAS